MITIQYQTINTSKLFFSSDIFFFDSHWFFTIFSIEVFIELNTSLSFGIGIKISFHLSDIFGKQG